MAYTTIDDPTIYFNTKLYTGNGSTQSITGVGFQPDWVWIKNRGAVTNHELADSVRGANKLLKTNATDVEQDNSNKITSFDSDGFGVGNDANVNQSSTAIVSWNWKAGGTASSNSDGSITSSVSANTTAGFSIATYTGTGSNANVGHGLSSAPELIITKSLGSTTNWKVHTSAIDGSWDVGNLNDSSAFGNSSYTASTNSIFYVGSGAPTNASSTNYVSYLLHSVKGYSKIGSYTGNGNASGTVVITGFRPAWLMVRKTSGDNWTIMDNKRNTSNPTGLRLFANEALAGGGTDTCDFLSNGFKLRRTDAGENGNGNSYIYIAFAESPFVNSSGIPCNAR